MSWATSASTVSQRMLPGQEGDVTSVAFSADGRYMASTAWSDHAFVRVWNTATGRLVHVLQGHTATPLTTAFSPDGRCLVSAGSSSTPDGTLSGGPGEVKLWDLTTGQEIGALSGQTHPVEVVAFSPDGKRVACEGAELRTGRGDPGVHQCGEHEWGSTEDQERVGL
mgnify:CR=1 FL=1